MKRAIASLAFVIAGVVAACSSPSQTTDIAAVTPVAPAARALFNGIDLTGWDGDPRFWRVEDGLLTGETTAANPAERNTFLIYRGAQVDDFELSFDYIISSDWANSGVQYRSVEMPAEGPWVVGGYQADIDQPVQYTGILYGERDRGILALRGQRVEIAPGGKPNVVGAIGDAGELARRIHGQGEWNTYRIVAAGNHATHALNGLVMTEITDLDAVVTAPDAKGARTSGVLALQLHTGAPMKIQFRNITLRPLRS